MKRGDKKRKRGDKSRKMNVIKREKQQRRKQ